MVADHRFIEERDHDRDVVLPVVKQCALQEILQRLGDEQNMVLIAIAQQNAELSIAEICDLVSWK